MVWWLAVHDFPDEAADEEDDEDAEGPVESGDAAGAFVVEGFSFGVEGGAVVEREGVGDLLELGAGGFELVGGGEEAEMDEAVAAEECEGEALDGLTGGRGGVVGEGGAVERAVEGGAGDGVGLWLEGAGLGRGVEAFDFE